MSLVLGVPQARADDVVDIATDPRFSQSVADDGLANPKRFQSGGIYLCAPVDEAKDVVLLVHGARGTPRDLLEVAQHLDPARQQAWFAYYASGDAIAGTGHALATQVLALMRQHGLRRISVLAHSMGGLVAWHVVHQLDRQLDVQQFVSVSTPWNGDPAARWGVWFSLAPPPVWVDLSPGSRALQEIHQGRLDTRFRLIYTVDERRGRASGDGVVSRDSETYPAMIRQAATVDRELGTHMSMLHGEGADRLARLLGEDATPIRSASNRIFQPAPSFSSR
jgi:pimeloyl-ACP methyl ester carboxylesterase